MGVGAGATGNVRFAEPGRRVAEVRGQLDHLGLGGLAPRRRRLPLLLAARGGRRGGRRGRGDRLRARRGRRARRGDPARNRDGKLLDRRDRGRRDRKGSRHGRDRKRDAGRGGGPARHQPRRRERVSRQRDHRQDQANHQRDADDNRLGARGRGHGQDGSTCRGARRTRTSIRSALGPGPGRSGHRFGQPGRHPAPPRATPGRDGGHDGQTWASLSFWRWAVAALGACTPRAWTTAAPPATTRRSPLRRSSTAIPTTSHVRRRRLVLGDPARAERDGLLLGLGCSPRRRRHARRRNHARAARHGDLARHDCGRLRVPLLGHGPRSAGRRRRSGACTAFRSAACGSTSSRTPAALGSKTINADIQQALTACQAHSSVECGIYTGPGSGKPTRATRAVFSDVPLWYAHYDDKTSLSTGRPSSSAAGPTPVGKQFATKPCAASAAPTGT